jgi:hypothetical protein
VGVGEKYLRDYALLNALQPGAVHYREEEVEQTDTPCFDGGVRGDAFDAPRANPPPIQRPSDLGPGWREYEIEDGAELLFGQLGER